MASLESLSQLSLQNCSWKMPMQLATLPRRRKPLWKDMKNMGDSSEGLNTAENLDRNHGRGQFWFGAFRMAAFEDSDFDVVGVSWTTSPAEAWQFSVDKGCNSQSSILTTRLWNTLETVMQSEILSQPPPALWAFLYDFNAARHAGVVQASAAEHVFTSYFLQVAKAQQGPNPTTHPSHISHYFPAWVTVAAQCK